MTVRLSIAYTFMSLWCFSQQEAHPKRYTLDANTFYGAILLHNPDISHLITDRPSGLILGLNKKTFGHEEWEQRFNYPDTGYSFVYQDMNNATLGENFGLYLHYNLYFFRRKLQLRIGQGVAYNTNPYDKNRNFRNNAYGSHLLSSTYGMLNYHRENIVKGLGLKAGISLIHYSNANFKAPNTSTNTLAFNAGLIYTLDHQEEIKYLSNAEEREWSEPVGYNLVFRAGLNETDIIDMGQYPFYIFSAYADKRIGRYSGIQLGTEVFFSNFLKDLIRFQAIAFPDLNVNEDDDFKRVGVFLGHELFVNKLSIVTQFGYYLYYPFDFEGRTYNRIGLKRYFGKKWFAAVSLKSHGAKAEAVEFGIGIRL